VPLEEEMGEEMNAAPAGRQLPKQQQVAAFYNSVQIQVFVACLIGANFLTNIIEKEIDPKGVKYTDTFEAFGILYNIAFTIELAVNIYAHWWCEFWKSGWNVFDSIVVSIGLINMCKLPLPPAFSMLRMMRAFRVFRLFKRVHSLNKIIVAIVHAVPGVVNAFIILFIVMSIYSILAVEFYTRMAEDCQTVVAIPGTNKSIFNRNVTKSYPSPFLTPRGGCVGPEYFGTFSRSLYTFFQVLTGESWSEMIARHSIWYWYYDPIKAIGGSMFFVSYVLITGFMLINVVVAVLLDKMSDPDVAAQAAAPEGEDAAPAVEDSATDASKDDAATNGVTNGIDDISPKMKHVNAVQEKVGQLVEDRARMRTDLDAFRSEVGDLKKKLATILEIVSSSNAGNAS